MFNFCRSGFLQVFTRLENDFLWQNQSPSKSVMHIKLQKTCMVVKNSGKLTALNIRQQVQLSERTKI
jgi:hypothetical protein